MSWPELVESCGTQLSLGALNSYVFIYNKNASASKIDVLNMADEAPYLSRFDSGDRQVCPPMQHARCGTWTTQCHACAEGITKSYLSVPSFP